MATLQLNVYHKGVLSTSLAALTGTSSGHTIVITGHTTAGDGGEGLARWDASDSSTTDNGGTVWGAGTGRWKRVYSGPLNPRWFGAKGDDVDDTTALASAVAAMSSTNRALHFPPGTYRMTAGVTISLSGVNVVVTGDRAEIKVSNASAVSLFTGSAFASLTLRGLHFSTTKTNSTALDRALFCAANVSKVTIEDCLFDRMSIYVNDLTLNRTASVSGVAIRGCRMFGAGTGLLGSDTSNFMDLRGIAGLSITDNDFTATAFERWGKISGACEDIAIVGNRFNSTSTIGKQLFDLYSDANRATIAGNVGKLSGTWTAFVESKNGDTGSGIDSEPRDIVVANNVVIVDTSANFEGAAVFGAWGLTGEAAGVHSCIISGNEIRCVGTTTGQIITRGMTHATISDNHVIMSTPTQYFVAIEASNCEAATISGNHCNGTIQCNGRASHPGATTYGSPPDRISITGNVTDDYGSLGAIYLVYCTGLEQLVISDNTCKASGTHSATNAINFAGDGSYGTSITRAVISGNNIAKNGTNCFGFDAYTTFTALTFSGNSFSAPNRTFAASDATPSVGKYPAWATANALATTITYFDDSELGDVWLVLVNDANTTIDCTGTNLVNSAGAADLTPGSGDVLRCTNLNGTKIYVERIDL